jgi:hypothetical protein
VGEGERLEGRSEGERVCEEMEVSVVHEGNRGGGGRLIFMKFSSTQLSHEEEEEGLTDQRKQKFGARALKSPATL